MPMGGQQFVVISLDFCHLSCMHYNAILCSCNSVDPKRDIAGMGGGAGAGAGAGARARVHHVSDKSNRNYLFQYDLDWLDRRFDVLR